MGFEILTPRNLNESRLFLLHWLLSYLLILDADILFHITVKASYYVFLMSIMQNQKILYFTEMLRIFENKMV